MRNKLALSALFLTLAAVNVANAGDAYVGGRYMGQTLASNDPAIGTWIGSGPGFYFDDGEYGPGVFVCTVAAPGDVVCDGYGRDRNDPEYVCGSDPWTGHIYKLTTGAYIIQWGSDVLQANAAFMASDNKTLHVDLMTYKGTGDDPITGLPVDRNQIEHSVMHRVGAGFNLGGVTLFWDQLQHTCQ